MRGTCVLVAALALLPAARAAEVPDRPILAVDAGGHTAIVKTVLFTPDGRELVSVSWDKTIRVWDVGTGDALRVLRPPIGRGLEGMFFAAALSPDGKTVAVAGYGWTGGDHPVYLIDLADGKI